ncbi:sn-glycerol-1-phosphate dehydrogenase [uncultured Propionibacterium sp.]|uniref:sn-glycerol-1-phosphate dehydrogenase n=1 Tax=uncultured Propionibacterium sp. TaxID=218066 RepID=UPI00292F9C5C|nr:sn-glycerol-1-phosphate dehydrogenase [uncultured Propionibacterium sp.]
MSDLIERALRSADDTDVVVMGDGVLGETGRVFTRLFDGARGIVVADGNTWAVAGEQVTASLRDAGVELAEPYVFPASPSVYAEYENVELLRELLGGQDVRAVVIGSGTLNDLVKKASDELGRRYMVVCTAASMDGYAAFGASVSVDGFKTTLTCRAPQGLIVDLPTLAEAPRRCTATGVGDLIEKIPAGADWILADELGIEPVDQGSWDLAQGRLRAAISDPQGLVDRNPGSFTALAEGLVLSGLSMQKYRISSRPASGAGHLFSHVWEMEHLGMEQDPPLTHGFKVGLGTLATLSLWQNVVDMDVEAIDTEAAVAAWRSREDTEAYVRSWFTGNMVEPAVKQTLDKYLTADQLRERIELIKAKWPAITARARAQLIPPEQAESILKGVGAFYHPQQVGLDRRRFKDTYLRCRMIRSRYTLPDTLFELGVLTEQVDRLFAPDGFWGRRPWTE